MRVWRNGETASHPAGLAPGFVLAVLMLVALAGAIAAGLATTRAASDAIDEDPPLEIADVVGYPARFSGERVRLSGQVAALRGPLFELGPERLLVYATPEGIDPVITPDDAMKVSGVLERFDPKRFEERFGRPFDEVAEFAGHFILVADHVLPSTPERL
jgi:hypothetical protein